MCIILQPKSIWMRSITDEIYYYRMDRADATDNVISRSRCAMAMLCWCAMVTNRLWPGHGYNVYYLNCLAGCARQLATTEDPDHVWVRSTWNQVDPRVPMVRRRGI
jgi:5-deoxy-D-glucuronate isomerase